MSAAEGLTLDERRRAAQALLDPAAHGLDDGFAPIPKALLGSLFEEAFAEMPARGLAYADEMRDISEWLTRYVALYSEPDRYEVLLATGAAWCAAYHPNAAPGSSSLELVRAVARFFLRRQVGTAADLLAQAQDERDDEQGDDEEGGAS
jgi:hypothetical protein